MPAKALPAKAAAAQMGYVCPLGGDVHAAAQIASLWEKQNIVACMHIPMPAGRHCLRRRRL